MHNFLNSGLKKGKFLLILFALLSIISFESAAQLGDVGTDPDFPDVPLDGGLSLLIGAGALYAGKKIRERKQAARQDKN